MSEVEFLPRVLVTRLLHVAQTAPLSGVRGVVLADADGAPAEFRVDGSAGGAIWAAFLGAAPGQPAPDARAITEAGHHAPRVLVAALDVQGVLRLELHETTASGSTWRATSMVET